MKSIVFCILCIAPCSFADSVIALATAPLNVCQSTTGQAIESGRELATDAKSEKQAASIFQAGFVSGTWSGHLKKLAIRTDANGRTTVANHPDWDAAQILTNSIAQSKRNIVTFNRVRNATLPFDFVNLPEDLQAVFNRAPDSNIFDNLGIQRVQYLYGERKMETIDPRSGTSIFRIRSGVLGDIVNSAPVWKGAPSDNSNTANYQVFSAQFKNRRPAVYVGANDGMLHAFSADTGSELFAYIPGPLLAKLPKLSYPNYRHEAYMDGKISVDEAYAGSWKTVLAAGIGAGARGLFALDVTSPDKFMQGGRVLFEFTEQDDPDIGYILSAPSIVKLGEGRYYVVAPSGYNAANPAGRNFVFLLSLDKSPAAPWSLNNNYYKLAIPSDNGAAAQALGPLGFAYGPSGSASFGYAGDLQGRLWRFDFSRNNNLGAIKPVLIFSAVDPQGNSQAITGEPAISHAPGGGYLVQFGTGKYVEPADANPSNFKLNSFYAIRDTTGTKQPDYLINGRQQLAARHFHRTTRDGKDAYQVAGEDFVYGDANTTGTKKGWYVDFSDSSLSGERSDSAATLAFGNVYFNTIIPSQVCGKPGSSRSYALNSLTGKAIAAQSPTGKKSMGVELGMPLILIKRIDRSSKDGFGRQIDRQTYSIANFDGLNTARVESGQSESGQTEFEVSIKSGRLSWREIQNWQDLK